MPEETTNADIKTTAIKTAGTETVGTETAGTETTARALHGVEPVAVAAFVEALTSASELLGGITSHLEAARVHDEAFGKLIDAAKVRDAYHARLPATEHNVAEARSVIDHFLAEFAAAGTA